MKKLLSATAVTLVLILAGTASAHPPVPPAGMEGTPPYMLDAIADLPPQQAMQMRDTLKEAQTENKEIYEQIHQLHKELYRILTAPAFNQESYLDKSNKLRELHDQADANLCESFTTALASLSVSQRRMIAQSMYEDHRHPNHHMKPMSNRDNPGMEEPGQYPSPPNAPVRP